MAHYKRTITAGPLVIEAIYPAQNPKDAPSVRQGKKALSSEAQRRMNLKYAYQKLEMLLAANFGAGDLFLTLTYAPENLPGSRAEAGKKVAAFVRRLRASRRGGDLREVHVTEHKTSGGRWHHHMVINSAGEDYEEISKLWPHGLIHAKALEIDREHTYEELARYMCKEARDKLGHRLWSCTRNLRKPERDTQRVPNDTTLVPPAGATVLDDTGDVQTAYGHYRFIKYWLPGFAPVSKPRRHRRRRKGGLS